MLPSLRPGTLGALLATGFGPEDALAAGRGARLERLALRVAPAGVTFELAILCDGRALAAERSYRAGEWPEAIELEADGGERERLRAALESWLAEEEPRYAEDLLGRALDALIRPAPAGSLSAWVAEHGLAVLNGEHGAMIRVEDAGAVLVLTAEALQVGGGVRDLGQVRLLVSLERQEPGTGALLDRLEQELYWGSVGAAGHRLPRPDVAAPPLAAWLRAWRGYVARRLARLVAQERGELPMPATVLEGRTAFGLMAFWLEEGPAPPEGPPRLRIAPAALERALTQVRAAPLPSIRARLRGRGLPTIQAALTLGRHTLVLAAGTAAERLGDTRVLLSTDGGEPVTLLRADEEIQNRLQYTLDGDAATMRQVLRWLARLLVEARLDRELRVRYLGGPAAFPLSEWLAFRGDNYDPDEPCYDPRLESDLLVDDHPHWDSEDHYLPPPASAEQERIRREDVPRYYAFVREVLDPEFVGRLEA